MTDQNDKPTQRATKQVPLQQATQPAQNIAPTFIDGLSGINIAGGVVRLDLSCLMVQPDGKAKPQPQGQLVMGVSAFCNMVNQLHKQAGRWSAEQGFPYPPNNEPLPSRMPQASSHESAQQSQPAPTNLAPKPDEKKFQEKAEVAEVNAKPPVPETPTIKADKTAISANQTEKSVEDSTAPLTTISKVKKQWF